MKEEEDSDVQSEEIEELPVDDSPAEALPLPEEARLPLYKAFGLSEIVRKRAFFPGLLEIPKDKTHWSVAILFILLAYLLSFYVRLEWIGFAEATYVENGETKFVRPNMVQNGVAVANTHDSFYFGSILQKAHLGMHQNNNLLPSALYSGMITALPYALLQLFPSLTIEQLLLWLPVWVAGFVCIPIVLIGRLYGSTVWGFFAACLAGITHSYYNRTLAGYYDTDMFSITIPAFALYFLLGASRRESLRFALAAAVTLYLYRFFYASGQAITGSLALAFVGYRVGLIALDFLSARTKGERGDLFGPSTIFTCKASILIGWATYAEAWSYGSAIESSPARFWMGLLALPLGWVLLNFLRTEKRDSLPEDRVALEEEEQPWGAKPSLKAGLPSFYLPAPALAAITGIFLICVMLFGGVQGKIFAKLTRYVAAGEGAAMATSAQKGYHLQFTDVLSTVREAGEIESDVVRNRILADAPSCSCGRCLPKAKKEAVRKALLSIDKNATNPAWEKKLLASREAAIEEGKIKEAEEIQSKIDEINEAKQAGGSLDSIPTAFLGLLGFGLLVLWRWEFCMGIPFAAIAYYCFQGKVGLRFTVHVGNIAALGVTFLALVLIWFLVRAIMSQASRGKPSFSIVPVGKLASLLLVGGLVFFLCRPNIQHARNYKSHVVYPGETVEALQALDRNSTADDFVVTWWDYGSGSWFYGGARTFTSPAHQTVDNFLTSEILRSTSQLKAANLCRLKAETYVNLHDEETPPSGYTTAVQALFKDGSPDLSFYPGLLADAAKPDFPLPSKTRDVYLFFPFEILRIFPTIMGFSTRNLFMAKQLHQYPGGRVPKPVTFLRGARRQGRSIAFDNGFSLDYRGVLLTKSRTSAAPYREILVADSSGDSARKVQFVDFDGLRIPSKPDRASPQRLLFLPEQGDLLLLSSDFFRSTLAKRFLLDRFDKEVYAHPAFAGSANLRRSGYMTQADWTTGSGSKITLSMRGGYRIQADLKTGLANLPGLKAPVKFSYHQCIHDSSGRLVKVPSKIVGGARYHLIRSNLPAFLGGRTYTVPKDGMTLRQIAAAHGSKPEMLASENSLELEDTLQAGETVEIPSRGYKVIPAWFFMADEIFKSLLVQGFLMENLDPELFQPVYRTPWGKVYRVLR